MKTHLILQKKIYKNYPTLNFRQIPTVISPLFVSLWKIYAQMDGLPFNRLSGKRERSLPEYKKHDRTGGIIEVSWKLNW